MSRRARPTTEQGTGGVEILAIGVLVLVMGTLLVANMWAVVDAKQAAAEAAREAVRVAVEAPDAGTAESRAQAAARAALTSLGRSADRADITLTGAFARCSRLAAEVRLEVPAIAFPGIALRRTAFRVRAVHSEVVDPYRSGLEGAARCEG